MNNQLNVNETTPEINKPREVTKIIRGQRTTDGDGVVLTRVIGGHQLEYLDPFLLLDAFGSDKPLDYIGGFPSHPHRGFETVTYMLAGKMRHQDSAGNQGVITAGGVQWMTAGKGIIHSEMPEQEQGLLSGLQLWVNLPKNKKMSKPKYQEYASHEISTDNHSDYAIKVIAGTTKNNVKGVIINDEINPIYWDIQLNARTSMQEVLPEWHNAFIYVLAGEVMIGNMQTAITKGQLAVLSKGDTVLFNSGQSNSRFIVIAGKPLNEPIARGGPFVMNTADEIQQAFHDYRRGILA
jgi:redox-sensitive bicupin YhaK (pirin superfamily)